MSAYASQSLLGFFLAEIGSQGLNTLCASQESKLAVLWNIGIFALNFGPVVIGPILDYVGPKLTAILGEQSSLDAYDSSIMPNFPIRDINFFLCTL